MEQEINYGKVLPFDTNQLDHELAAAEPVFEGLLQTSVQRFLVNPDDYNQRLETAMAEDSQPNAAAMQRAQEVRQRTSRGLYGKVILEACSKAGTVIAKPDWLEGTQRWPEFFERPADPNVVRQLAAFGQAYMHDMYQMIGITAPRPDQQVTVGEQEDIIGKLYQSVHMLGTSGPERELPFSDQEIHNMTSYTDENGNPYYDPLRMSAAAYPNRLGIIPTCGAQMAIAAGYWEAAGWPHLTASPFNVSEHEVYINLNQCATRLSELASIRETPLLAESAKVLLTMINTSEAMPKRDLGFHGCNLLRMNDGMWRQVDFTRHILYRYDEQRSATIDKLYSELQAARSALLPHTVVQSDNLIYAYFQNITEAARFSTAEVSHKMEEANNRMGNQLAELIIDDSSLRQVLRHTIAPLILPDGPKGELGHVISESIPRLIQNGQESPKTGYKYILDTIYNLTVERALPEIAEGLPAADPSHTSDLQHVLAHAKGRQFLAAWLESLPLVFYMKQANDLAKTMLDPRTMPPHQTFELTMPDVNIANILLSNYAATYSTDDERLPAAFWSTYDPTHMGSLVHLYDAIGTPSENLTVNNANLLRTLPVDSLLNLSKRSRINMFLEASGHSQKRGNHGGKEKATQRHRR